MDKLSEQLSNIPESIGIDSDKIIAVGKTTLKDNVSLGLILASALAWNEWIKEFAQTFVKNGDGWKYSLMFAVTITIMMVVFEILSERFLGPTVVEGMSCGSHQRYNQ